MKPINNEYMFNGEFKKYVDKYCEIKKLTVDEALKDEQIKREFLRCTDI